MKLLLDTHMLIWAVNNDPRLAKTANELIEDPNNELFFSLASVWEMGIKIGNQKLDLGTSLEDFLTEKTTRYNLQLLPIRLEHLLFVSSLAQHHKDPFDRLLIAQSMLENIPLLSQDTTFHQYPIQLLP